MEQSDALGLTGSAGMGGAFSLGTRFSTGSSKTTWHTLPVGATATSLVRGMQLGGLEMGVQRALEVTGSGSWLLNQAGGGGGEGSIGRWS